ncbi:VanZ family protein [Bacteroidota bacterium]
MLQIKVFRFAFFGVFIFVLLISILPKVNPATLDTETSSFRIDYFAHFIAFFVLAFFFDKSNWTEKLKSKIILISFLLFYAFFCEAIQHFIPSRAFNPIDLMLNEAGFITAIILFYKK